MKRLVFFLVGVSALGSEMIFVGNESTPEKLISLSQKYRQDLFIEGDNVYVVSKECRLERYFGGVSQGELKLVQGPVHTETIPLTQEVFDAKDTQAILQKIEREKSVAIAEAKISKAFLEDKEGRGYGGASQIPLDFSVEKAQILKAQIDSSPILPPKISSTRQQLQCEVLDDGSGYRIDSTQTVRLFSNGVLTPLINNTVLFH